jgi:tRNA threonylcarbamoyl adenosine modification protein YeaZ
MKQIIVDTSTSKSSLILVNNDSPVYEKYWESENNHSKDLYEYFLVLKEKLGNIEDVDQITVLLGPGGFNSIRVGISFVLGIASSYNINILGIPSHVVQVIDFIMEKKEIISVIPCGKNKWSWAKFSNGSFEPEKIGLISDFSDLVSEKFRGEILIEDKEITRDYKKLILSSEVMKKNKGFTKPADVVPIYSKGPSISKPKVPYKKLNI